MCLTTPNLAAITNPQWSWSSSTRDTRVLHERKTGARRFRGSLLTPNLKKASHTMSFEVPRKKVWIKPPTRVPRDVAHGIFTHSICWRESTSRCHSVTGTPRFSSHTDQTSTDSVGSAVALREWRESARFLKGNSIQDAGMMVRDPG